MAVALMAVTTLAAQSDDTFLWTPGLGYRDPWFVLPVVFGVLTTENLDQALARSEGEGGENAGYDGARTAVEMAKLVASITKLRR